jgi:branched-chain amino acid transport system substrate-binding protein
MNNRAALLNPQMMPIRSKTYLVALTVVAIAFAAVAIYAGYRVLEPKKITVAVDAPIMNKRVFDPSDMDAARLYFEENPDSRMQLREVFYDFEPSKSPGRFEAAMADGVEFFVTTQPSSTMVASSHLFQNPRALLINTSATSPTMSGKDDFILRIIADGQREQQAIADYINTLEGSRVLVLQDRANAPYTDPAFEYFAQALAQSGRWEIRHERFTFEDFKPSKYQSLMAEPADVLYLLGGDFQSSMGNMVQLFHQYHPDAPIVLTPWARGNAIYETAGPALPNMVLLGHHRAKFEDPAIKDYLRRFNDRFGYQPMAMAFMVRQALELLEQAIAAGHTAPDAAKQYLLSQPELTTSLGVIEFDASGDSQQALHPITDLSEELKISR